MKVFLSFLLLLFTIPCYAHGFDTAQSIDTGKHHIEFGMTNQTPSIGQRIGMSFSVDDKATGEPIAAPQATVRISKGDQILFISNGFALRNDTILSMSFTFIEPGTYDIDFRTGKDSATFPVTVHGQRETHPYAWIGLAAILGIAFGVLLGQTRCKPVKKQPLNPRPVRRRMKKTRNR